MPITKALKTRLQKLIDAVNNDDINELWTEFSNRMHIKERQATLNFRLGDEVYWQDKNETFRGTIIKINQATCKVKQDDVNGSLWKISSTLLTKDKTLVA